MSARALLAAFVLAGCSPTSFYVSRAEAIRLCGDPLASYSTRTLDQRTVRGRNVGTVEIEGTTTFGARCKRQVPFDASTLLVPSAPATEEETAAPQRYAVGESVSGTVKGGEWRHYTVTLDAHEIATFTSFGAGRLQIMREGAVVAAGDSRHPLSVAGSTRAEYTLKVGGGSGEYALASYRGESPPGKPPDDNWRHLPGLNGGFDMRAIYFFPRQLDLASTPQAGRLPHFGGSGGFAFFNFDLGMQTRSPLYFPLAGFGIAVLLRDGMRYATDKGRYDVVASSGGYGYLALPGIGARFTIGDWLFRPSLRPALHGTTFVGASLLGMGWHANLEVCSASADYFGVCVLAGAMTDTPTGAPVGAQLGVRALVF